MTGQMIGQIMLWLIVAVVAVFITYWVMNWLYRRSTKEVAFVRTGFLGEKVVIDRGAFVFPIVNDITPVNMNSMDLAITREKNDALITKDHMRIDVKAEFYVRVAQNREAVSLAASTLGRRTLQPEGIHNLLEGKFVSALRTVTAEKNLKDIHESPSKFVERIREMAQLGLDKNGLELETVALIDIDQTDIEYFNPSNQFDAEGLTAVVKMTEGKRKIRNDIEQETSVQIRERNLNAERHTLDLERQSEEARLTQEKDIEFLRAQQKASLVQERETRETEAEQTRIEQEAHRRKLEIDNERTVEEAAMDKSILIHKKSLEESSAAIVADEKKAEAAKSAEKVKTASELEAASRMRQVDTEIAHKKAEEVTIAAKAEQARVEVEAKGRSMVNEAENILTDDARNSLFKRKMLKHVEGIIAASVKPLEKIKDIRIVELGGTGGGGTRFSSNTSDNADTGSPSPTDEVINSALRYRAQAPMVDSLLSDIGIDGSNIAKSGGLLREAADLSRIENEQRKNKQEGGSENTSGEKSDNKPKSESGKSKNSDKK